MTPTQCALWHSLFNSETPHHDPRDTHSYHPDYIRRHRYLVPGFTFSETLPGREAIALYHGRFGKGEGCDISAVWAARDHYQSEKGTAS